MQFVHLLLVSLFLHSVPGTIQTPNHKYWPSGHILTSELEAAYIILELFWVLVEVKGSWFVFVFWLVRELSISISGIQYPFDFE
jgi:hypothetical protein